MTSATDLCNRALSEIGARVLISDFNTESSPAAVQCKLFYDTMREQCLRSAPWGFARKTLSLTTLGLLANDPPDSPYPWQAKYAYPSDCLKMRYVLPPPFPVQLNNSVPNVSSGIIAPWCPPSRQWRYLVSMDDTVSPPRRVVLSNVIAAIGVYTANVEDPDLFDPLFTNALTMALASKLVIPLTGNVGMKGDFVKLAEASITAARVADGNEAVPTSDVIVDWMVARGTPSYFNQWGVGQGFGLGDWNWSFDNIQWSM